VGKQVEGSEHLEELLLTVTSCSSPRRDGQDPFHVHIMN